MGPASEPPSVPVAQPLDLLIVGAGFSGMHMLHAARGLGLHALVVDAAHDVGGAWYWNRYPGARCDVESLLYSYSFSSVIEDEWRWSERYAAQAEILAYLKFVADRLRLRHAMRLGTRIVRGSFSDVESVWEFEAQDGAKIRARYCVMATGPISMPILPDIAGMSAFKGEVYHTAQWPQQELALEGKRIGVIGTGSSGTQVIPMLARQASALSVFLRTPNFTVPARNRPLTDADHAEFRARRADIRASQLQGQVSGAGDLFLADEVRRTRVTPSTAFTPEQRQAILAQRYAAGGAAIQLSFSDIYTNEATNEEVSDFIRARIAERVQDPRKAELLVPRGYPLGTKRICVDTDYYETFGLPHVRIHDVRRQPIERFVAGGPVIGGETVPLDVLVLATGFDALTGALSAIDLRGSGGVRIQDAWKHGPQTWLGIMVHGFPNLFMIGGPGSPSVFTNVVRTNEIQVEFLATLLDEAIHRGDRRLECSADSQTKWTQHVNSLVRGNVLEKANSWYVGANVPGKPRNILAYTGGFVRYIGELQSVRASGYAGLERGGPVP